MRSLDLRTLGGRAWQVAFAANSTEFGGANFDGDPWILRRDEWVHGFDRIIARWPLLTAPPLVEGVDHVQRYFKEGMLRATGPAETRARLELALHALAGTLTGRFLLHHFTTMGGEIEAVTDPEFMRRLGLEYPAGACLRSGDGRPLVLMAAVWTPLAPEEIASALAHEITHGVVQNVVDRLSQGGQATKDAFVWNETMAATIQARVELELGLVPKNLAANPDGSLRSPEETAEAIRRDPVYAKIIGESLPWPLAQSDNPLIALVRGL
jgi:hypothetical protein